MAALDALFMHLYGLNEDDAAYILDTFPIVRQQDEAAFGRYRTKDDVLRNLRHLQARGLRVEDAKLGELARNEDLPRYIL